MEAIEVVFCGSSVYLCSLAAGLQPNKELRISMLDNTLDKALPEFKMLHPHVIIAESPVPAAVSALQNTYPGLLLIGIDMATDSLRLFAGEQSVFSVDELAQVIFRYAKQRSQPGPKQAWHNSASVTGTLKQRLIMKSIIQALALFIALSLPTGVYGAASPDSNAGVILNQSREFFRRQEIDQELEAEKKRVRDGAEAKEEKVGQETGEELRFVLKAIEFPPSKILTPQQLEAITRPYLARSVAIKDLYLIVDAVNAVYRDRGYVTCRAGLPPQTITSGVVKIELVEGSVGEVAVKENATTAAQYVKSRLPLKPGDIVSLHELNRELLWFNGTNDVQLRIQLKAGAVPGTTDYIITAYEPPPAQVSLFADNAGSETSGLWRHGFSYSNRSVSGNRDQLTIGGMFSQGTNSGSISYNTPISTKGTRLGFSYSANSVKMVTGPLRELDTHGNSSAYGLSLTHPLSVTKERKVEAGLEWSKQASQTDILGIRWADDNIERYGLSLAVTDYGQRYVQYQRHTYSIGTWQSMEDAAKHFEKYQFSGIRQQAYDGGQILTVRLNGQLSGTSYLPASEQFYLGGVYSVRGYRENLIGADNGFSLSIEYAMPLNRNQECIVFLDGGGLSGDNTFDDHDLTSAGCGYRINFNKDLSASLMLGLPLRRNVNGEQLSNRLHVMINGQLK